MERARRAFAHIGHKMRVARSIWKPACGESLSPAAGRVDEPGHLQELVRADRLRALGIVRAPAALPRTVHPDERLERVARNVLTGAALRLLRGQAHALGRPRAVAKGVWLRHEAAMRHDPRHDSIGVRRCQSARRGSDAVCLFTIKLSDLPPLACASPQVFAARPTKLFRRGRDRQSDRSGRVTCCLVRAPVGRSRSPRRRWCPPAATTLRTLAIPFSQPPPVKTDRPPTKCMKNVRQRAVATTMNTRCCCCVCLCVAACC